MCFVQHEEKLRRETISAYLKEAGVALRPPRGRRVRAKPASRTGEVTPDSTPAKPASEAEDVTTDAGEESAGGAPAKPEQAESLLAPPEVRPIFLRVLLDCMVPAAR